MKKFYLPLLLLLSFFVAVGCSENADDANDLISSRSYSGHESDKDANNFVRSYPKTVATRLDDCQLCHTGKSITTYKQNDVTGEYEVDKITGKRKTKTITETNPCNYCHIKVFDNPADYAEGFPSSSEDTLNGFGLAYKNAGRTIDALKSIENLDSDGDGYSNIDEINDNRFPGNPNSKPGQPFAPAKIISESDLATIVRHNQFMLMNTTKQQYDDYANYEGVTLEALITSLGINIEEIDGIDIFSPDGYKETFAKDEVKKTYPDGVFHQTDEIYRNVKPELNCVKYPEVLPEGLTHKGKISNPAGLRLILALVRDGKPLSTAYYDSTTGKLEGEGPYRVVVPQDFDSDAEKEKYNRPDRGSRSAKANPTDGYHFFGDEDGKYIDKKVHNAGRCNRGACIIRINKMPAGYEEYDTSNGWSLLKEKQVVIYGYGIK